MIRKLIDYTKLRLSYLSLTNRFHVGTTFFSYTINSIVCRGCSEWFSVR
jgi:hypothetical protein